MEITFQQLMEKSRPQIEAIIEKAEIRAKGVYQPPEFDLEAIKARAEELDPKSQTKADMYMLIMELERLNAAATV